MANLKRIVSILFHLLGPFFIGVKALALLLLPPRAKQALPIGYEQKQKQKQKQKLEA